MRFVTMTVLLVVGLSFAVLRAQSTEDVEMSAISGRTDQPRRHFRLRHAANLDPERAAQVYAIVGAALARGYGRSKLEAARSFRRWRRHNSVPYRSAAHGNHYLNNYVNAIGDAYGCMKEGETLPVGSIIAKDSFSVTESGGILLGPLFLMEKMSSGFSYVSGDWRYTMILPDGAVAGTTGGEGAERVEYCIGCHLAMEHQDHLYFVPEEARAGSC